MVFQKGALGGYDLTFRYLWLLDQSSPDFFSPNAGGIAVDQVLVRFEYLYLFQRYLLSKFEVIQNWAKFCMFLAPKILWGWGSRPPKFWTHIIKLGLLLHQILNLGGSTSVPVTFLLVDQSSPILFPNLARIALDQVYFLFSTSQSVSKIFASKLKVV